MLLHNGNSNTGSDELIVESIEVSVSSAHENVDIELSTIEQTDHKQFHDIRVTSHETTHRIQSSIHQSLSRTNFYQIDHLSVVYMTSSLVIISIFILLFLNIKRNVNKKNKFPSIISSISSSNISNPSLQIDIFDAISHDQSIDNMYVSMSEAKRTISSESMEVNISNTESLISLSALDALESLINSNINTFEFLIKYRLSKGNQNFSIQAGMKSTQMLQDWVDLKRQVLETSSVLDINKIRTLTSSHNQVKLVETKLRSCIEPVNSTSSKSTLLPQTSLLLEALMMYEESEISSLGLEPVDQLAVEARHRLETLYTEEELNDYTKIAQNIKLAVTDLETQFGTLDINGGQGAVEVLPSSPVFLKNRSLNLTSTAESVAPRFEGLSTSSSYKSLGSTTDTTVLLVTESNKVQREYTMELERCQTRRIRERREAAEKARTEVRTQFARREQNLRDTVRLLEDRCHRRQTALANDCKKFEEFRSTVENKFEERKAALNQSDLYLWLACNVLIFTSYGYACASCEAKQSIANWSSQQSMSLCRYLASDTSTTVHSTLATASHGYLGLVKSYWPSIMTLPSRDLTALTNRGIMYLFTQFGRWNVSLSSFLPVSLDALQCGFQLCLHLFVPIILSKALSYIGLSWLSYWLAFGGSLVALFPILMQVFYANYSIWLLFAVHALMQIILHYFDHSVAWIVSFYFKKGGSSLNFDIRFISVYLVYPTLLWLGSLLLGCYESIPESRGLKLHYQSKSTWELVSKCFSDVFLEHKC